MTGKSWLCKAVAFGIQRDSYHMTHLMSGISLCTEAQAQKDLTVYLRSHRGKNKAGSRYELTWWTTPI